MTLIPSQMEEAVEVRATSQTICRWTWSPWGIARQLDDVDWLCAAWDKPAHSAEIGYELLPAVLETRHHDRSIASYSKFGFEETCGLLLLRCVG